MNNKVVIYTAIFGGYDNLIEPEYIPSGCDFICFTDGDFKSDKWKIVKSEGVRGDSVRSARKHKILAHRYLPEYEYSVWVDGNLKVIGDVNKLIEKYLQDANMAVFSHKSNRYNAGHTKLDKLFHILTFNKYNRDSVDCLYDEAKLLLELNKEGKFKEDPDLIKKQVEAYRKEGYPEKNGMLISMAMLRRHNEEDVKKNMEDWWNEVKKYTRRDQLSFNFVAWKNDFNFVYMKGDSRRNKYFYWSKHLQKK